MQSHIPLIDLGRQRDAIDTELHEAIEAVLMSCAFVKGSFVSDFESDFAGLVGVEPECVVGCGNGTDAIMLALLAAGIGPGDEVIVPVNTFVATAEPVVQVGATPVFVDVESGSYNIDPSVLEPAITTRTRAIIPVHLYGTPCQMNEIIDVARRFDLLVIEDCAQAHLAQYCAQTVGTLG
ncbi:MAG: aminotransferase class V-fold PLP-dependent enzyme, partial [Proteobacteria bacterium]|nr:aminotransferase class V-fold PLP-dependent enzyme [Pseudomonadota bacterium]